MSLLNEWLDIWLTSIYLLHMDRITMGFVC